MKLVTFRITTFRGDVQRIGVLNRDQVIDLNAAYACYLAQERSSGRAWQQAWAVLPPDMTAFFHSGKEGMAAAELTIDYVNGLRQAGDLRGPRGERILYDKAEIRLMAPVPRPNSLRDCLAFEGHFSLSGKREIEKTWYEIPVYYKGNSDTVLGPEETIFWPCFTDLLDYELEYGIYIGKEGINIPRQKAQEYIAGYTIFNDISARDIQMQEMSVHLGPAKGKDTCSIMGPCLVTPDEIDPSNLRMTARVNGELWSDGNSGTSYWSWGQIIEYISLEERLYPGDFIGSGTVEGGCSLEHGKWFKPGDIIELEVEGIGILRNRVGEKPPKRTFSR